MNFAEKIKKMEQMDQLIRLKATGNPKSFAKKLDVSESSLFELLKQIKEFGAECYFNRSSKSYEYATPMKFEFRFKQLNNE